MTDQVRGKRPLRGHLSSSAGGSREAERQSGGGQRDLDFKLENLKNFHLDFKVRLPPAPQCFFDVGASAS